MHLTIVFPNSESFRTNEIVSNVAWSFKNAAFGPCFRQQWSRTLTGSHKQVYTTRSISKCNQVNCHNQPERHTTQPAIITNYNYYRPKKQNNKSTRIVMLMLMLSNPSEFIELNTHLIKPKKKNNSDLYFLNQFIKNVFDLLLVMYS